MEFKYNVTGSDRRRLVAEITEIRECNAEYIGAPTFAYRVDNLTIDKNGTLSFDDRADNNDIEMLVEALLERGFEPESRFADLQMAKDDEPKEDVETNDAANGETTTTAERLSIGMPRSGLTDTGLSNLRALVASKAGLLKKALGTDALPIKEEERKLYFDWFPATASSDELDAYAKLVTALVRMAKTQKRVTAVERETENEKYAFRCFLLRLGFIGEEYKAARKLLLRNLSGNGAFKAAQKTEVAE